MSTDKATIERLLNAQYVATCAHHNQLRKYSKLPYIVHPIRVAKNVLQFGHLCSSDALTDVMIAGYLHDTLEDTDLEEQKIEEMFGENVLDLVKQVTTDNEAKAKFESKGHYLADKMLKMTDDGFFLKLMDRLDNITDASNDYYVYDEIKEFAFRYKKETIFIMNEIVKKDEQKSKKFKEVIDLILETCGKIE